WLVTKLSFPVYSLQPSRRIVVAGVETSIAAIAGAKRVISNRQIRYGECRFSVSQREGTDRVLPVVKCYGSRRRTGILRRDSHCECNQLLEHRRIHVRAYARRGGRLVYLQREPLRAGVVGSGRVSNHRVNK